MPPAPVQGCNPHISISACPCQDPHCQLRLSPEVSYRDCQHSRAEGTRCCSPAEQLTQKYPDSRQAKGCSSSSIDPPETTSCKFMKNAFPHLSTVHQAAVTALTQHDDPRAAVTAGSSTACVAHSSLALARWPGLTWHHNPWD